jgi:hypothetical protein
MIPAGTVAKLVWRARIPEANGAAAAMVNWVVAVAPNGHEREFAGRTLRKAGEGIE